MRAQYQPKIILSVSRLTAGNGENSRNFLALQSALKELGISFITAWGVYQGVGEASVCLAHNERNYGIAKQIARHYEQECILLIDNEGQGHLDYTNGKPTEKIGAMVVSKDKPKGDHTYFYSTREYLTFNGVA